MELEYFNRKNTSSGRPGEPRITFNPSGCITLTPAAAKLLKVLPKDGIQLVYDKKENQWYAMPCDDQESFELRDNKGNRALQFNASEICKKIIAGFEIKGVSVKAMVSTQPIKHDSLELWPLLMKAKPFKS